MKNIAVVYGGYSSEWKVSVASGKNVAKHIDASRYAVYEVLIRPDRWSVEMDGRSVDIDRSDFSFQADGRKVVFDKVVVMIHGNPGENGLLQAYFELMGVPYTGCSPFVSSVAFDKYTCKSYLRDAGVSLPKDLLLRKGQEYSVEDIAGRLGLPIFVKPNIGGSSFGVTKVKKAEDLKAAVELAFTEGDNVILEESISGREVTCGTFRHNGKAFAMPVTEIITDHEYFDYEAKYLGASKEVCPADLPAGTAEEVKRISASIYDYIGARGVIRIDYIIKDGVPYFLEINLIPGMTEASLVPKQLEAAGISMQDFLTDLIEKQ